MRRATLALAVVAAATILAAPCFAFDDVFQQTYPLPPGGSVELHNVNGSVRVTGWDRNEVQIHAVKSARHDPRDLERVQIAVQARTDSVAVATRYPVDDGVEVYVEYRIRVPRHVRLKHVATVNGSVRVSGVEGWGELRSVNGNVEVLDSSGRLNARTTNGNVHLELRQVDPSGPLAAETVNGSIVLALPPDAGAELDVRSVNGDFQSELPLTLEGSRNSREFHGRLGSGGSPIRISTVNGAIRVVPLRPVV